MTEVLLDTRVETHLAWFFLHDSDDRFGVLPDDEDGDDQVVETADGVCVLLGDQDPVRLRHGSGGRERLSFDPAPARPRRARAGPERAASRPADATPRKVAQIPVRSAGIAAAMTR
jgi:hypothetical protein